MALYISRGNYVLRIYRITLSTLKCAQRSLFQTDFCRLILLLWQLESSFLMSWFCSKLPRILIIATKHKAFKTVVCGNICQKIKKYNVTWNWHFPQFYLSGFAHSAFYFRSRVSSLIPHFVPNSAFYPDSYSACI